MSVSTTPTFHLLTEEQIVKAWQKIDIYAKLLQKAGCDHYILREMPAAIHHFKLDTFKCKIHQDVFLKVNMVQGKGVAYSPYYYYTPAFERRVLNSVQKDGAFDSLRFRRQCRREFQREVECRQQQLDALGIFGDWESTGKNLDPRCEAKIITTFNKLRELGYINKVQKSGYWCQKCHSTLNEDEIEFRLSQAYSGYVKFPVSIGLEEFGEDVYFAVWVAELWQLAGSVALGLKPNSQYLITECGSEVLILAEEDLTTHLPVEFQKNINILRVGEVDILADCVCAHPFLGIDVSVVSVPELPTDERLMSEDAAGCVLSLSAPTGVRHLAPGHHPNDYQIAQALRLPIPSVVDDAGCLTEDAEKFCGLAVSEAGKFIAFELEKRGYLIRAAQENIPQPHCWTCGASALFRPVQQWVFSLDRNRLRHRVLHSNDYWANHYSQEESQRIQQTIREFSDLCVSCRRGWGIPIPVFHCERCGYQLSDARIIKTLRDVICRRGSDAWFKLSAAELLPPDTTCPNCDAKEFQKEPMLLDGRFATLLHAIHNSDMKKNSPSQQPVNVYFFSPNSFYKWFAQFILASVALHNTVPFKKMEFIPVGSRIQPVKMSETLMEEYSKDVLRILALYDSWHPDFDHPSTETFIQQCQREYNGIQTLFYTLLNELVDFNPCKNQLALDALLPLDWLALAVTNQVLQAADLAYRQRCFFQAWCVLRDYCESDLQQFYLPLLRARLKASESTREKRSAQTALWEILHVLIQRFAPITPFLSEQIYALTRGQSVDSSLPSIANPDESQSLSVFLEDWIAQINISHIGDAQARWKELVKRET